MSLSRGVADVYVKWIQGPVLFPQYFPDYHLDKDPDVQAQCSGKFDCLAPDRVTIASIVGHMSVERVCVSVSKYVSVGEILHTTTHHNSLCTRAACCWASSQPSQIDSRCTETCQLQTRAGGSVTSLESSTPLWPPTARSSTQS